MLPALSNLRVEKLAASALAASNRLYAIGSAHLWLAKDAATPKAVYSLAGRLYLSKSGWLLLDVPAAFVRGLFDALHEPGAELPLGGSQAQRPNIRN